MGSFYLTRHSNLSEVHTVFHLVTDDSLSSDINSRHAVILGLRNILKACFKYDVVTLSIPLLLSMELTEVSPAIPMGEEVLRLFIYLIYLHV